MARDNQRDNQKAAAAGGENASEFKEKMVSLNRVAKVGRLIPDGPESLCKEIISAVKAEVFLSETERKN